MKKLITPFLLLALTLVAAAPVNITTFTVTCDGGYVGGCFQPHFVASPLDQNVSYQIDGYGPNGEWIPWGPFSNATSIDDATGGSLTPGGTWNFEIHALGNNGNEKGKVLASTSVTTTP